MDEQEKRLALELAETKALLKGTQEFFQEALAAILLHTQPSWHFSPKECERAREAHPGIMREEDGGLTITLEEEDEELAEADEEDDYFTEQLNKRLGFDVRDLQALQQWWRSFMEKETPVISDDKRTLTIAVSRGTLLSLELIATHHHESINAVIERLAQAEGKQLAEHIEQSFIEDLQGER